MALSLGDADGAGLERSCDPEEWVDAAGPVDGVELFRARLRGRPFRWRRSRALDRYPFARQFHAVHGTSPYRYSVMRRLDVARSWLRDARPLAETALEAGFADQAHFTRTFKAAFGMTPGRYVKLCRPVPVWRVRTPMHCHVNVPRNGPHVGSQKEPLPQLAARSSRITGRVPQQITITDAAAGLRCAPGVPRYSA